MQSSMVRLACVVAAAWQASVLAETLIRREMAMEVSPEGALIAVDAAADGQGSMSQGMHPGLGQPHKVAAEGAAAEEAEPVVPEEEGGESEEGGRAREMVVEDEEGRAAAEEAEREEGGESKGGGEDVEWRGGEGGGGNRTGWWGRRRRRAPTPAPTPAPATPAPTPAPTGGFELVARPALLASQKKWARGAILFFQTPVCKRRTEWKELGRWHEGCPGGWENTGGTCIEKCDIVPHIGTTCGVGFCTEDTAGCVSHVADIIVSAFELLSSLMGLKPAMGALKSAAKQGSAVFKKVLKEQVKALGKALKKKAKDNLAQYMKMNGAQISGAYMDDILEGGLEQATAALCANDGDKTLADAAKEFFIAVADPGVGDLIRIASSPDCRDKVIRRMPEFAFEEVEGDWHVVKDGTRRRSRVGEVWTLKKTDRANRGNRLSPTNERTSTLSPRTCPAGPGSRRGTPGRAQAAVALGRLSMSKPWT